MQCKKKRGRSVDKPTTNPPAVPTAWRSGLWSRVGGNPLGSDRNGSAVVPRKAPVEGAAATDGPQTVEATAADGPRDRDCVGRCLSSGLHAHNMVTMFAASRGKKLLTSCCAQHCHNAQDGLFVHRLGSTQRHVWQGAAGQIKYRVTGAADP